MTTAFSFVEMPDRPAKPRSSGVTMMIDWGISAGAQQQTVDIAGQYIDLAKIAVGLSRLVPEEILAAKIAGYRAAEIEPFPGGQFLEVAHSRKQVQQYYEECRRVGYHVIEVSDNVVPFTREVRERLIRQAIDDHGLRVLGEVGSKHEKTNAATIIDNVRAALAAGAWKVFVEAAEFVGPDGLDIDLLKRILDEIGPDDILFELPGRWIPDVHAHQIYQMMVWLTEEVGADVNIGNVPPEDVLSLETLRTGLGVNMKL